MTSKFVIIKSAAAQSEDRGDLIFGENQGEFLDLSLRMGSALAELRRKSQDVFYLCFRSLSPNPWRTARELLDKDSVDALLCSCEYDDVYLEHKRPGLLPLGVLTLDWQQYAQPEGRFTDTRLDFAAQLEKEASELHAPGESFGDACNLDTLSRVLLGSGYTFGTLPSDGSVVVDYQFARLSNGDILVLAGLEWFNK